MLAMLGTRFAASAIGRLLPAWAWKALAVAAIIAAALLWHQHAAHKAINAAYHQGKADEAAAIQKRATELKAKIDTLTQRIAAQERVKNDEENRRIARDADSLRVQGPGHAACPRLPAAASRHAPSRADADAPGPALPPTDSAAVQWGWLVTRAEEHDALRAEVLSWREWYRNLAAAWPKAEDRAE